MGNQNLENLPELVNRNFVENPIKTSIIAGSLFVTLVGSVYAASYVVEGCMAWCDKKVDKTYEYFFGDIETKSNLQKNMQLYVDNESKNKDKKKSPVPTSPFEYILRT